MWGSIRVKGDRKSEKIKLYIKRSSMEVEFFGIWSRK